MSTCSKPWDKLRQAEVAPPIGTGVVKLANNAKINVVDFHDHYHTGGKAVRLSFNPSRGAGNSGQAVDAWKFDKQALQDLADLCLELKAQLSR